MKQTKFQKMKQKGFTLLELLVVITLLAILSVGALVAYEGIGENASDVAAANNIKTADSAIRTYRAIENVYPNQWDNLANLTGAAGSAVNTGSLQFLATPTRNFFGQWQVASTASNTVWAQVAASLAAVGVTELQTLQTISTFPAGTVPNLAYNESVPNATNPADELEWDTDGTAEYNGAAVTAFNLSIVPSSTGASCTADSATLANTFNGATVADSSALNLINDGLDNDGCHLVLALGFGKDVPGTTLNSRVAISTAPTYTSTNVNPSENYARYIALFHVASADEDGATPNVIQVGDVLPRAKLLAVVDPEGRTIDQAIAGGFQD